MFAVISDLDAFDSSTTFQLVEFKYTGNKKVIEIIRSLLFKTLQPGEMEFPSGSTIPKKSIQAFTPEKIISYLFTKF